MLGPMAMLFPEAADLPAGSVYHDEMVPPAEGSSLLEGVRALAFGEVRMRGRVARRRTILFGWPYGYESWGGEPGPPLPYFLLGLRARVAPLASVDAEALAQGLVTHYPTGAGIGRPRDRPPL